VQLPNGYVVVEVDSANRVVIDRHNEIVIQSDIESCNYTNEIVFGVRSESKFPIIPKEANIDQPPGPFILNLLNGESRTGIDRFEYESLTGHLQDSSNCMPR